MKIIVIGGNGTIGKRVVQRLKGRHELIIAGRSQGDVRVDIADPESIVSMFETTGIVDAIVCIGGEAKWAPFDEMSEDDFYIGIKSKLMGQVNLVRLGRAYLIPGGSFTLTTGILADDPVRMTTGAALVNGAIHSFVKAAALELTDGLRINVVAPGLVEDAAEKYESYFPGYDAIPMNRVVNGYIRSIEGKTNGEVIRIYA